MKKISFSEKGFSIIEVLATAAALSVVVFGFLGWSQTVTKGFSNLNENDHVSNTFAKAKAAFGNDDIYCTKMLEGRTIDAAIPEIRYYDDSTRTLLSAVVARQGDFVEGSNGTVTIQSLVVKPIADLGPLRPDSANPRTMTANLEITFNKHNGPGTIVRRIPMNVVHTDGVISECSTGPAGSLLIQERFCWVQWDGYNFYKKGAVDPDNNTSCLNRPTVAWSEGATPTEAQCPAGTRIAASPDHYTGPAGNACRVDGPDGVDLTPRSYSSGFTARWEFKTVKKSVDFTTNTCTFIYPVGVDTTVFKSYVKCTPI